MNKITKILFAVVITIGAIYYSGNLNSAEAAVTFRAATAVTSDTASPISLSKPTGTVDGDIMIAVFSVDRSQATPDVTPPAGWTQIDSIVNAQTTQHQTVAFYRVASGEGASYSFSFNTQLVGAILTYTGNATSSPIDAFSSAAITSSASYTAPSINTTVANTKLVILAGLESTTSRTFTNSDGNFVERLDGGSTSPDTWLAVYDKDQAGTGATGTSTATASSSSNYGGAIQFAIKPYAAPTATPTPTNTPTPTPAISVTTTASGGSSYSYFSVNGTFNNNNTSNVYIGYRYGTSNVACASLPTTVGWWNYSPSASNQNFAQSVTSGVNPSTTYYYCIYALDNNTATYYYSPSTQSVTTSARPAPTVSIYPATLVDNDSAWIGAGVDAKGAASTGYFRWGTSNVACSSLPNTTTNASSGSLDAYYYPRKIQLTGLSANTTYYYCFQSTNGTTGYSSVTSFTTPAVSAAGCSMFPSSAIASGSDETNIDTLIGTDEFKGTRIYQGTVNGWTLSNFHTAVDNQGAAIILIKTATNKVIGGFTPLGFASSGSYQANAQGLLFSLTNNYKLDVDQRADYMILFHASFSYFFGAGSLSGGSNQDLNAAGYGANATGYYQAPSTQGAYTYLSDASSFTASEVEVYKVEACTTAAPTVTTPTNTSITATTATLGGNVTSDGGAAITGRGVCVGTSADPSTGCTATTGTTGVFTVDVTGLTQNTLYHYRAYATNSQGTTYTTDDTFTTLQGTPSVTTDAASSITQTTATINSTVNPNSSASTGWFRYFTSDPGTCSDAGGTRVPSSSGTALGSGSIGVADSRSLTGLTPGTTYYVCAFASNTYGTAVGAVVSFASSVGSPTLVSALGETGLGSYYVTLEGSASPNNYASYGFFRVYTSNPGACTDSGGTRYPTSSGDDLSIGSGDSGVGFEYQAMGTIGSADIDPGTTYYYCAYARNSYGTVASGEADSFTTPAGAADPCDAPLGGNHTVSGSCSYSGNIGGVDAGTGTTNTAQLTIASPRTLTINSGQSIAWGTISMPSGAAINLTSGGSLRKSPVWVIDADADGFIANTEQTVGAQPAGGVRRNSVSSNYAYMSTLSGAPTLDCNDSSGTAYQTVGSLVQDADNDGYKTSTAAGSQCVGGSSTVNGRTYYRDTAGDYTWLPDAQKLSSTADCYDNAATPCPAGSASAAATSQTQINVTWGSTTGPSPTAYDLKWCSGASCTPSTTISNVTSTYAHTGRTCGTTYGYTIVAKNATGSGDESSAFYATTNSCAGLPTVTTGVSPSARTTTTADLISTVNPSGAATTVYYRYGTSNTSCASLSSVTAGTAIGSGTSDVSPTTKQITGISANTRYYWCAYATNSQGTTYGAVNNFYTLPNVPTNPAAAKVSDKQENQVTWTASSGGASGGYRIYYCTGTSCTPSASAGTDSASPFTHTGLSCGTVYGYNIVALSSDGVETDATSTVYATTTSGSAVTCYYDADNDGRTIASPTSATLCGGCTASTWESTADSGSNADCYDNNSNAKPGQTSYFTSSRGDGSFDYNCDGSELAQVNVSSCTGTTGSIDYNSFGPQENFASCTTASGTATRCTTNYNAGYPVACGVTGVGQSGSTIYSTSLNCATVGGYSLTTEACR